MGKLPAFFDESMADQLYLPRYSQIMQEAIAAGIPPAAADKTRIAVFIIDMQVGFCNPGASLFVPGAVEDTVRACRFIYRNLKKISRLYFSLDTHQAYQIFYPPFWADAQGNHPAPFTIITAKDVRDGIWRPTVHQAEALDYVQQLESGGRYHLCIWPFHTMMGSLDHALVPILFECALYHSIARRQPVHFQNKGENPLTENYSVLSPEVKEVAGVTVGSLNTGLLNTLIENDRIYIMGEASSHCVKETIADLQKNIHPELAKKVYILEDCMSPVPAIPGADFPAIAAEALEGFKKFGMNVVRSTEPLE